jgi:hypothetical protein
MSQQELPWFMIDTLTRPGVKMPASLPSGNVVHSIIEATERFGQER